MSTEVILRRCSSCKEPKPLDQFHKNKNRFLGHVFQCKACKSNYQTGELGKAVQARYRLTPAYKSARRKYRSSKRYKEVISKRADPKQMKARGVVRRAILSGIIERPQLCSHCRNDGKIEAHHYLGYAPEHWLHIIWLCVKCHNFLERFKFLPKLVTTF